jgi:hypothetical protein
VRLVGPGEEPMGRAALRATPAFSNGDPTLLWTLERRGWVEMQPGEGYAMPSPHVRLVVLDTRRLPGAEGLLVPALAAQGFRLLFAEGTVRMWGR